MNIRGHPQHVAIIMDGNGRWANARGLPRIAGHKAGVDNVREVVRAALDHGIPVLTLYAFSQENWKRPKEEISFLMSLLDFFLKEEVKNLVKEGVSLRSIGRIDALPEPALGQLKDAVRRTAHNKKMILNIALNYGSRTEILDAVNLILEEARAGRWLKTEEILDEQAFAEHLYTKGLPDPDLLIRTSGEMRLSNFLLWQLSYAEIYITGKYWPDFKKEDFAAAIEEYARRERRFGDVRAV